jgi:DNA-binding response OmpR family regulator
MIDPSKHCIMVVNQGATSGTDLVDALRQANYSVIGPFSECSDASDWLASGKPHGALLDMLLTDDSCFDLARDLRERGVPYLFHSPGQADDGRASFHKESVPPFNSLLNAITELIRKHGNGAGE